MGDAERDGMKTEGAYFHQFNNSTHAIVSSEGICALACESEAQALRIAADWTRNGNPEHAVQARGSSPFQIVAIAGQVAK